MHILIYMNLTAGWVQYLHVAGHEVVHWAFIDYARLYGYVLLTNNLGLPRILAHTKEAKPSVVLLRSEPLIPESRGATRFPFFGVCKMKNQVGFPRSR